MMNETKKCSCIACYYGIEVGQLWTHKKWKEAIVIVDVVHRMRAGAHAFELVRWFEPFGRDLASSSSALYVVGNYERRYPIKQ